MVMGTGTGKGCIGPRKNQEEPGYFLRNHALSKAVLTVLHCTVLYCSVLFLKAPAA